MITNQYSILAIKSYGQWVATLGGIDYQISTEHMHVTSSGVFNNNSNIRL